MEEEITREIRDKGEIKTVSIDFRIPDNYPTSYANEMITQTIHTEFILSFFELKIPLPNEENSPSTLRADCIARVALSADKIPDIINVLATQHKIFLEHRHALKKVSDLE